MWATYQLHTSTHAPHENLVNENPRFSLLNQRYCNDSHPIKIAENRRDTALILVLLRIDCASATHIVSVRAFSGIPYSSFAIGLNRRDGPVRGFLPRKTTPRDLYQAT
jgi:hypothetical protein